MNDTFVSSKQKFGEYWNKRNFEQDGFCLTIRHTKTDWWGISVKFPRVFEVPHHRDESSTDGVKIKMTDVAVALRNDRGKLGKWQQKVHSVIVGFESSDSDPEKLQLLRIRYFYFLKKLIGDYLADWGEVWVADERPDQNKQKRNLKLVFCTNSGEYEESAFEPLLPLCKQVYDFLSSHIPTESDLENIQIPDYANQTISYNCPIDSSDSSVIAAKQPSIPSMKDNRDSFSTYQLPSVNTILYGPPGTGKTYNTRRYALATCFKDAADEEKNKIREILSSGDDKSIKTGYDALVKAGRIRFVTFHQSYGYEEFIQGISAKTENGKVEYFVKNGVFVDFCETARGKMEPYIFIIDEINRGNISKIFGELITLIENTKREDCDDAQSAELPHGGRFSVPKNVYILGTMNTADRSIAMLDTALRRRFDFIEMMPKPKVLEGVTVGNVKVDKLLESINARIEFLYDREHTIGHAFFTPLLKEKNCTIETLKQIFRNKVIPLLQEYFYDDYEKIQQVLGASFVKSIEAPPSLKSDKEGKRYTINSSDHWNFTECFEKNKAETKQDETA